jgi:hypothetical protein
MSLTAHETVLRLVDAFERDVPEYSERLNRDVLCRLLGHVYGEVLQGENLAKTEDQLDEESRAAGIEKPEYEALVNLVTHAATDQPIQK